MSRWKTTFEGQQPNQLVQKCIAALEGSKVEKLAPPDLLEYARLLKVLKVLAVRIAKIDPELFSLNTWGSFSAWLNDAHNNINNFKQNQSVGHLQNANGAVDNVLGVLRPLDAVAAVDEFKSLADAHTVFQQKLVEEIELVRSRGADVRKQADSVSVALTQTEARITENNQVIQQQKTRLDQSIAEYQKQFSEAQEKRTKDFADILKKNSESSADQSKTLTGQFNDVIAGRKKEYASFMEDVETKTKTHLSFLQKRQEEVNEIFGAIGTTAFAGNFKTTADQEAAAANLWRWIALALMAAMIGIGAYAFYYSIGHETDWRVFAFRLGTVFVLAVPAIYAANESSKHRERERLNRKVHLELASLDAYLVLLPEVERNKIKGNLTERFFGVPVLKEKGEDVSQKDLFGVLTNVLNNLTKGK